MAIYARVSTSDQNCESQLRELRDYVARRGWQVIDEYVDTGSSGSKASRPQLDRLMADAAKHRFDCLAVFKIDRFGRSVLHLNQQLATLQRRPRSDGVRSIGSCPRNLPHQPRSKLLQLGRTGCPKNLSRKVHLVRDSLRRMFCTPLSFAYILSGEVKLAPYGVR